VGSVVRKRRTRQHIIADLGINYVERKALLAGFAVDRVQMDYGIDFYFYTFDDAGGAETGHLLVQVKATDHVTLLSDQQTIAIRVERADVDRWTGELLPVVLVLYDAQADVAYWLYVQSYFSGRPERERGDSPLTTTLHISRSDRLDAPSFRHLAARKNATLQRTVR
jgi:hypothetical protein